MKPDDKNAFKFYVDMTKETLYKDVLVINVQEFNQKQINMEMRGHTIIEQCFTQKSKCTQCQKQSDYYKLLNHHIRNVHIVYGLNIRYTLNMDCLSYNLINNKNTSGKQIIKKC